MEVVNSQESQPLNFKEWALNIFLVSLPLIGVVLLFVWAFSDSENVHRREWAKGRLLIAAIAFAFAFIILFLFGGLAAITAALDR